LPDNVGEAIGRGLGKGLDGLRDMDIRILRQPPTGEAGEQKSQIEIMIKTDDGKSTKITRETDGKIHVTHTDKDGKETSAVYDNPAALEKGDAEAFGLFEEHANNGRMIHVRPFGEEARKLRGEFQINIEKKVREALERAKQAQEKAEREVRKHLDAAPEAPKSRAESEKHRAGVAPVAPPPKVPHTADKGWSVRVGDDGTIRLLIDRDGEKKAYQFSNKDEFKTAEPQIYEHVKGLFE
jgi:hypothetical protein